MDKGELWLEPSSPAHIPGCALITSIPTLGVFALSLFNATSFLSFFLAEGDHEFLINDHFSTAETPNSSQQAAEGPWWDMLVVARTQTILHSCSPIYCSKTCQFHRQRHRNAAGLTFLRNHFLRVNTPSEIIIFYSFLWVVILHKDK